MSENNLLPSIDEMPVLTDAVKVMKLDLAVSDLGEVCIFHERPMPEPLNWVEYDREAMKLYFISENGRMQGIGMTVLKKLDQVIAPASRVFIIHRRDGVNISAFEMPLVHQL